MIRYFILWEKAGLVLSLGLGVLLLNINMDNFSDHQPETRPLCDHDG